MSLKKSRGLVARQRPHKRWHDGRRIARWCVDPIRPVTGSLELHSVVPRFDRHSCRCLAFAKLHCLPSRQRVASTSSVNSKWPVWDVRRRDRVGNSVLRIGSHDPVLGAQIAKDVVASSNALVNGGTIALFAVSSAVVTMPARRLTPSKVIIVGAIIAVASSGLLAVSALFQSLIVYTVAQAGSGMAYSLLLLAGLSLITAHAPVTHRGGTLSALFLVAYLAQAVVALALGKVATTAGLPLAVDIGVSVMVTLATVKVLLEIVRAKSMIKKTEHARQRRPRTR